MGPTASGKTRLALELTQHLPCDIISVDSAMVYRGMDIGTAKPTAAELALAPHRLIDIADPADPYSAGHFCRDATKEIEKILANGRIPLLVGGTMLYFRALQNGLSPLPSADPAIRQQIAQEAAESGWPALHQRLQDIDPIAANRIRPQDAQRIARALEIHAITGISFTEFCRQSEAEPAAYRMINLALMPEDRTHLAQRIAIRFKQMLQQGLIAEVAHLKKRGDLHADMPSMRAVGYRQVWDYLASAMPDAQEMEERAVIATRQLAKRQMTWLRSWPQMHLLKTETTEAFLLKQTIETYEKNKQ
jgi:tRNA dimethylallyltransferase